MKLSVKDIFPYLIPFISFLLVWLFDPGYLISIFLFYLLPAMYIAIWYGKDFPWAKILSFSAVISIPFFIVVDYIGTASRIWAVPESVSIMGFRFLNILPVEDYFWLLSAVILILCHYHKINSSAQKEKVGDLRISLLGIISICTLIAFGLIYAFYPGILIWRGSLAYLALGSVFFLIPGLLLSLKYRLVKIEASIIPFFLLSTFLFEMVATHHGYWMFTGNYLFHPLSLGGVGYVPLEELFFVGIAGPIAGI